MAKQLTTKQRSAFIVMREALGFFSLQLQRNILVYAKQGVKPTSSEIAALHGVTAQKVSNSVAVAMMEEFKREFGSTNDPSQKFFRNVRTIDALVQDHQRLFINHLNNAIRVMNNDFAKWDTIADQLLQTPGADLRGQVLVGRRVADEVRRLSMSTIEDAVINGRGRASLVQELRTALKPLSYFKQNEGQRIVIMKAPYTDVNLTRNYNLNDYTEMVALTTTREAEQQGKIARAGELNTSLVIYNHFNKEYKNDPVCGRINGRIFSLVPEGENIGNIYVPYWRDPLRGVPGQFLIAHPRCRHQFRPIDARVALSRLNKVAS